MNIQQITVKTVFIDICLCPPFSLRLLKVNSKSPVDNSEDEEENLKDKESHSDTNKEVGVCGRIKAVN